MLLPKLFYYRIEWRHCQLSEVIRYLAVPDQASERDRQENHPAECVLDTIDNRFCDKAITRFPIM